MSGIYIPGMEMPKRCGECPLSLYHHSPCWKNGGAMDWENRPNWCPLVAVPDHGRLIDADALLEELRKSNDVWADDFNDVWLGEMPTIIPADKEGE